MGEDYEKEFLSLIEKHSGILYKVTRVYASDVNDEKDLRQEIIYQAWRSFSGFKAESKFSTWFYKVALNTALTHTKKAKQNQVTTMEPVPFALQDSKDLLISLIKDLSAIDKLVIMLHLDGYTNDEVAAIAGLKKNHVAVKIYRLKDHLKLELEKSTKYGH